MVEVWRGFVLLEGLALLYLLVAYLPANIKYGMLFLFTLIELIFVGLRTNDRFPPFPQWYGTPLAFLVFTVALIVIYAREKPV
jgi:hypothetical protein